MATIKNMRKIKQISTTSYQGLDDIAFTTVFALCDNDRIYFHDKNTGNWIELPPIHDGNVKKQK